MTYKLHNTDIMNWQHEGDLFHAMLCDPPYHLTSIVKRFGKENSAPAKHGTDGVFQRASKGFMGQEWDGGDVATKPETWYHLGQFLYPGAFCMAFSSTRTVHRMMVAIEDAGFVIHPMIAWVQGQGFPKATRIDTQIDRMKGKEQKVVGKREHPTLKDKSKVARKNTQNHGGNPTSDEWDITEPATPLAKQWEGHRYGAQALKPSFEPIVVFQKPYEGKPVENMIGTGAGALNIDGGRIGIGDENVTVPQSNSHKREGVVGTNLGISNSTVENFQQSQKKSVEKMKSNGRWPANFILGHTPDCKIIGTRKADSYTINRFDDGMKPFGNGAGHEFSSETVKQGRVPVWECVDGCPVKTMDEQSGVTQSGAMKQSQERKVSNGKGGYHNGFGNTATTREITQSKGGASRFFFQSDWQLSDPFFYCPKASKSEKDAGVEDGCSHPTIKPLKLTQYLATLLLPPTDYAPRRILVPFSGTGSEMIGAHMAGWEMITGIELGAEYIEIAKQRLAYWTKEPIQKSLF